MAAAISLRDDFSSADLHDFAKASKDADQTRRLLALAAIYDGARRSEAARIGGVDQAAKRPDRGQSGIRHSLKQCVSGR